MQKGLILVSAGPTRNVIRILAPLTTPMDTIHEGLDILESAIEEADR